MKPKGTQNGMKEREAGWGSPSGRGSMSNRSRVPKHTAPLPTRLSGEPSSTRSRLISSLGLLFIYLFVFKKRNRARGTHCVGR